MYSHTYSDKAYLSLAKAYTVMTFKPIILIIGGLMIFDHSDTYSSVGLNLTFVGIVQLLATSLLFLLSKIINLHNKKDIMMLYESIIMISVGLLTRNEPHIWQILEAMLIVIGGVQLFIMLQLYLWSNIVNLQNIKSIVMICEPIMLIICGFIMNDVGPMVRITGGILGPMLMITGGIQLYVIIIVYLLI